MGEVEEIAEIGFFGHAGRIVEQPKLYNYGCAMPLDVVTALFLAGLALNEEALRRLAAAGHPELRISHGFLIQHVVDGPRPVGELADRMGVSQQAASKAVAELVGLGYLERTADSGDARVRRIGLSARGREAVELTRTIRAEVEHELAGHLGTDRIAALRRDAWAVLEWTGGADAVRARRVPDRR
jgi:DNA-binding MarR family transcriptional regulator